MMHTERVTLVRNGRRTQGSRLRRPVVVLSAVRNVLAAEVIVAWVSLGIEDVFMALIQMERRAWMRPVAGRQAQ